MLDHETRDAVQLVVSEASIVCPGHRLKPELGDVPISLHVDVRRFSSV